MTERLYYKDSHLAEFDAAVLYCEKARNGYAVVLDRTAFFPEGGGQSADTGKIGAADVTDVREEGGEIRHFTAQPVEPGREYRCRIDWDTRFSRMQNHSGEHIVSGLVHKLYGYDNVGFHMGEECVTIDFNGELTKAQLGETERLANEAVTANLDIVTAFPTPDELDRMNYRSKKELAGSVRIVTIPGVDVCACCAPHVAATGEIGLVKLLSSMRHRGGVRIEMVCGSTALADYRQKHESVAAVSAVLSAKQAEVLHAVERTLEENERLKYKCGELAMELVRLKAQTLEQTRGNICIFDNTLPDNARRELVNAAVKKCSGVAAVFSGSDGDYRYIIGSASADLRAAAKVINAGIGGRGGGSPEMIQGSASKSRWEIQEFLSNFCI